MIINNLKNEDIGKKVVYTDNVGQKEQGIIKSWNDEYIFVVYNCAGDWYNYKNYTAAATDPGDLEFLIESDSANYLFDKIMSAELKDNLIELGNTIFLLEDTSFSAEQNKTLSSWLLTFAKKHRDIEGADSRVIFSAIRTGSSMLRAEQTETLIPLLSSGHKIETSLVTVKMIGRIFEAQPPKDINQHEKLAIVVRNIADLLINPYSIMSSESAAQAQLAAFSLSAMASELSLEVVTNIIKIKSRWFTTMHLISLNELKKLWEKQEEPINKNVMNLLNKSIDKVKSFLGEYEK